MDIGDCLIRSFLLGVSFDTKISMEQQIANARIGLLMGNCETLASSDGIPITTDAARSLTNVASRIDYCNSLLQSLPGILTKTLQRVQNTAARLTRTPRSEHITPVLRELH